VELGYMYLYYYFVWLFSPKMSLMLTVMIVENMV